MKTNKYIKILIVVMSLLLVCILGFRGIEIYINKYSENYIVTAENIPYADAVMVLGAYVYNNEAPSPVLEDRLLYAYDLYRNGKVKKILVSGDHGTKEYDEVNVMRNFLIQKGVPANDIFMDHAGFDTYDSMYRAKIIFQIKTLLISTQEFHIRRAVYIARRLGIDAYSYPCLDKDIYNMEYLNSRERLAKIKAFLDVEILRRKPKFEGEAIPIWKDGTLTEG